MSPLVAVIERLLSTHPAPALPLQVLLQRLREAGPEPRLDAPRLRTVLERHPDRFRVLEVWRGGLDSIASPEEDGSTDNPWVALLSLPADQNTDGPDRLVATLRESVRWLARGVDDRSSLERIHWQRLVVAEAEARGVLTRAG